MQIFNNNHKQPLTGILGGIVGEKNEIPTRKMLRHNQVKTAGVLHCVRPVLNTDAMALTIDNYREFVARYNEKVKAENEEIKKYNAQILPQKTHNEVQKAFLPYFYRKYGVFKCQYSAYTGEEKAVFQLNSDISEREYNEKVAEFNNNYGFVIPKQKVPTIKANAEQVFQQLLYAYSLQLERENQIRDIAGSRERMPLRSFRICSTNITYIKRNGNKALDVCSRTILNHRKRFEEAGILSFEHNLGNYKNGGVLVQISPEILVVFDRSTQKLMMSENQSLTYGFAKKITDITMNIQEQQNKSEIKANVENHSPKRSKLTLTAGTLREHLREHPEQGRDFSAPAAPADVKVLLNNKVSKKKDEESASFSEKLVKIIQSPEVLCDKLAQGFYDNYEPLAMRYLDFEALKGTLSLEEYREILVQEILKQHARNYIGKRVFAATWQNAYNVLKVSYFVNFNGVAFAKSINFERYREYRWRLNYVYRFCLRHKEFRLLFPSEYFDRTRTTRHEGGFEYTAKAWKKHLQDIEKNEKRKEKAEKRKEKRTEAINAMKTVQNKIKQFLKGRISIEGLVNFVAKNHPEFSPKLSEMVYRQTAISHKP